MINTAQDPTITPNSNEVTPLVPESIGQNPEISQPPETTQFPQTSQLSEIPQAPETPQTSPPSKMGNKRYILILGAIAIFALIIFVFIRIINNSKQNSLKNTVVAPIVTPTPAPTPTPIPLIPDEGTKGNYRVTQGTHVGPTFTLVTFDPLVVDINQTLTITVKLTSKTPIDQVTGILTMDHSQADLSFQKTATDGQVETWQANTLLKDSVLYNYILSLSAKSGSDSSTITIAPRAKP
jgi:hypothetical protein